MNEKAHLKRIAAQNKVFKASVEAQKDAIAAYNKAKTAQDKAFLALMEANKRVDKEKYALICIAIGQKAEPQSL
jgi:hypothetical protein